MTEKERRFENFKANLKVGNIGPETFEPIGKYILPATDKNGNEIGGKVVPPFICSDGKRCSLLKNETLENMQTLGQELIDDKSLPSEVGGYLKWLTGKFEFNVLFAAGYRPDIESFVQDIKYAQNPKEQAEILREFQIEVALNSYTGVSAMVASNLVKEIGPERYKQFAPEIYQRAVDNYMEACNLYYNSDEKLYYNSSSSVMVDTRDIFSKEPADTDEYCYRLISAIDNPINSGLDNVTTDINSADINYNNLLARTQKVSKDVAEPDEMEPN